VDTENLSRRITSLERFQNNFAYQKARPPTFFRPEEPKKTSTADFISADLRDSNGYTFELQKIEGSRFERASKIVKNVVRNPITQEKIIQRLSGLGEGKLDYSGYSGALSSDIFGAFRKLSVRYKIRSLNLNDVVIPEESVECLTTLIRETPTLEYLSLNESFLGEKFVDIFNALQDNTTIRKLSLWRGGLHEAEIVALQK